MLKEYIFWLRILGQNVDFTAFKNIVWSEKRWEGITFLSTFMANIFPVFAPVTFRTWKTCTKNKSVCVIKG